MNRRARVVTDNTAKVLAELAAELTAIEDRTAADVAATARANIKRAGLVDTGALLDGITVERTAERTVEVSAPGHGTYAEFGTRYLPARPWFTPAAVDASERIKP